MFKKIRAILSAIMVMISTTGCSNNTNPSNSSPKNSQVTDSNLEEVEDYKYTKFIDLDTPYTMCFQNTDGTYTMYIFAAPVQYFDGEMYQPIDNSIVPSEKIGFAYENKANSIKAYLPEKISDGFVIENSDFSFRFYIDIDESKFEPGQVVEYTNIYNQLIEAVCYKSNNMSLYFYFSNAGIEMETVFENGMSETPPIIIDYNNDYARSRENLKNGYIVLRRGNDFNDIDALIYSPIALNNDEEYTINLTPAIIDMEQGIHEIKYEFENEVYKTNQSIVLYTSNMPDSCAYSTFSRNQYLSRFSFLGNSDQFGKALLYIRYRLDYFLKLNPDNVIDTSYNIVPISKNYEIDRFILQENLDQWSSTGLTWINRNKEFSSLHYFCAQLENGYISFDITEYAKKCFADETWMTESYGITLEYNGDMQIIASSDNPVFIPYLEINLSDLPNGFIPMDDINLPQE